MNARSAAGMNGRGQSIPRFTPHVNRAILDQVPAPNEGSTVITERQLRARARSVQTAEARMSAAMTARDADIAQAAAEGRFTKTQIAGFCGLTKARIGTIAAVPLEANDKSGGG